MSTETRKSNAEILKEVQAVVDEINKRKAEVEVLLQVIDNLELKYIELVEKARQR